VVERETLARVEREIPGLAASMRVLGGFEECQQRVSKVEKACTIE